MNGIQRLSIWVSRIAFNSQLGFRKDDKHGRLSASGSTVVKIGKTATLAVLGDKTLTVTVTESK